MRWKIDNFIVTNVPKNNEFFIINFWIYLCKIKFQATFIWSCVQLIYYLFLESFNWRSLRQCSFHKFCNSHGLGSGLIRSRCGSWIYFFCGRWNIFRIHVIPFLFCDINLRNHQTFINLRNFIIRAVFSFCKNSITFTISNCCILNALQNYQCCYF